MSKQTEYSNAFIRKCERLFQDIRENKPLKICIETLREAQQAHAHPFEPLWFIYYMYFAIHNPKLEEYINMKHAAAAAATDAAATDATDAAAANILKNMNRRRTNTSTLVFQLYMYANIQKGAVTYIYPASTSTSTPAPASTPAPTPAPTSILKSLESQHLKTAAAVIHKIQNDQRVSIETIYNAYIANAHLTAPTLTLIPPSRISSSVLSTRLSNIKYNRKDIILLALVCYMKIDENDINTKGIFISATKEEITVQPSASPLPTPAPPPPPSPSPSPYDEKYKYLLT